MKKLLVCVPLLLAALMVRADLVVEQTIESPFMNGKSVTKIKGDQMRIDSPMPGGGSVTSIVNSTTGDATTLIHAQKMAMKMNINAMQKQLQQATGQDPTKIGKPRATGQKEKVGQHEAEIYEMNVAGQTIKMWAAKDYPDAQSLKDQMNKLAKASSGGMFDPSQFDVPGMVVKTEMNTPQGKIVSTLTGVRQELVADTEFQVPAGYQSMQMPQLPQAPAPAAPGAPVAPAPAPAPAPAK